MTFLIFLIAALPLATLGQETQPDFNLTAYLGKWYEMYHTRGIPFQSDYGTDITAEYALAKNGSGVEVTNREYNPWTGNWREIKGIATVVNESEPGIFSVRFGQSPPGDYRVLYTDYNEIAAVYSKPLQMAWILSRKTAIDDNDALYLFALFRERVDIRPYQFVKTAHGLAKADAPTVTVGPQPPAPPVNSNTNNWIPSYPSMPAQLPAQYPAQMPAQYPAQMPAQYPAQMPAQVPAQMPAQQTQQNSFMPQLSNMMPGLGQNNNWFGNFRMPQWNNNPFQWLQ